MAQLRLRQDIWALEEQQNWHPITEAYALGIAAMQSRAHTDPTSWVYQAAVHAVPAGEQGDDFRDQCQHGSWFFLPWHRAYLYWFERILRAAIQADASVSDDVKESWALPYWNYGRGGKYASLPQCFREPTHNNAPNPLYVVERAPGINNGAQLPAQITSASIALGKKLFSVPPMPGQSAGFGGPVTGWSHNPLVAFGALEQTPHNDVHVSVGGAGFMSAFDTAPLDPVFWLHHCNLDRLWVAWLKRPNRANPTKAAWKGQKFRFHDERGVAVTTTPAKLLITVSQLGYTYDPTAMPATAPAPAPALATAIAREELTVPADDQPSSGPPPHPPELVAATEQPLTLAGEAATITLTVSEPRSTAVAKRPPTERYDYLNIEGIEGERNPGIVYGVYLNLPDPTALPADDDPHHIGNLSFFGLERVRDAGVQHAGPLGLRQVFNITDTPLWSTALAQATTLTVTFVPLHPIGDDASHTHRAVPPVTIGRISLYQQ
jgi:tyrosinase